MFDELKEVKYFKQAVDDDLSLCVLLNLVA